MKKEIEHAHLKYLAIWAANPISPNLFFPVKQIRKSRTNTQDIVDAIEKFEKTMIEWRNSFPEQVTLVDVSSRFNFSQNKYIFSFADGIFRVDCSSSNIRKSSK